MSDRAEIYRVRGPKALDEMTGAEVVAALAKTDTVLIPVGALEHHGPHLPLGTDTIEAREMARRTVLQLGREGIPILLGPAVPFGFSSYHLDFPGSVSLTAPTLLAVVREVCLSLYRHGLRKFILLPGHGGNCALLQVAAQEVVDQTPDAAATVLNWIRPVATGAQGIQKSTRAESHGGERETAMVLAAHPELVNLDVAVPHYAPPEVLRRVAGPDNPLAGGGVFHANRTYLDLTPVGSIGDGRLATPETGEALYALVVDWLCAAIRRDVTPAPALPGHRAADGGRS